MSKFEVVFLTSPELATTNLNNEILNFKKIIKNEDGKIINEEEWGLRDLSYKINKYKKAFYTFLQIELKGTAIEKIKRELNQLDNILRYIFIKVDQHQELPTLLKNEKK
tara:strand:- start:127 stop:453 length:327 start_codon:yes stop_codon:yes gene_type:complete